MIRLPKVLTIAHNHPDLHPGGTEIFSHGLFRQLRDKEGAEAVYLACVNDLHRGRLPGTLLQSIGERADELLLWTGRFDRFTLSQPDLHGIVPELERFLRTFEPDVVHFHHILMIGLEALLLVRRVLPRAAIVMTLHDYYAICAHDGLMITLPDRRLCARASPDSCAKCFPGQGRDQFVLRELAIKQAFSQVDRFISPSNFLKSRYVDWGLAEDRITVIRNGIETVPPVPHRAPAHRRDHFAFFGHLIPAKGAPVALEAARRLAERTDFTLALHGSADFQTEAFKADLTERLAKVPSATWQGGYGRDEIPARMAEADWVIVPSMWCENDPLVIREAFLHRRPVLCGGIGGMAESVRDGIDGLWYRSGDPQHLAEKMEQAMDPDLWARLAAGIRPPRTIAEAAQDHLACYESARAAVSPTIRTGRRARR